MAPKSPPKATTILATPIGDVKESRAQRLHRQQSRFRDRGGIFVPSSRNILADILLGKASPIKKPRRSASLSPCKGRRKLAPERPKSPVCETSAHEENLRRGPRKKGRGSSVASAAAGSKPFSKVSSRSGSKTLADSTKPPSEADTRKVPTNTSNEDPDDPALVKERGAKKTSASRPAKKPKASKAQTQKTTKKVAKAAENQEENGLQSKKKTVSKANATISSASRGSEPHETVLSIAALSKSSSSAKPSNSKKSSRSIPIDDEDYESEGVSKNKRKKSKPSGDSQSSSSTRKSSSRSSAPSKPPKSKPGGSQLPDIMEEDEDEPPPPTLPSRKGESPQICHESSNGKKRPVSGEDVLTDSDDRPRKRAKPARKDTKVIPKRQLISDEEPAPVQRKRRHAVEQEEHADMDAKANNPAKRKRVVSESEEVEDKFPLKVKKSMAKPAWSKSASKAQGHSKPTAKVAPTKTAKRKENSVVLHSTLTEKPPRRGLPKSVLLHIMNSSAPHVVDDEPDPIDFLS